MCVVTNPLDRIVLYSQSNIHCKWYDCNDNVVGAAPAIGAHVKDHKKQLDRK